VASPPVPQPRNSPPAAAKAVPEEPAKKPALGQVHLSAPVVTRGKNSLPNGEALPSIDTNVSNPGTDSLANVATTHGGRPTAPLLVGGEVTPAQLIKSVPPIYPPFAKAQRISGNVQLDALIDASGNVAEVKVISGPSILHRAALDAVKQWKYKPAVLDGQATTMHLTVTVQFRSQ
jgi:protein TonB